MTYGNMPQGNYRLAEKLRAEYRNRGASLQGIGAASTEELMARAQMGRDPRQNVSEEAFSDRLRDRNYTYTKGRSSPYRTAQGQYRSASDTRRTQQRYAPPHRTAERPARPETHRQRREQTEEHAGEVQVAKKRLPYGFLVMLVLVTTMFMSILFSIAQIYQTTGTIDDLERTLSGLQETAAELELALEEKNDIRVIEKIATDQLGMVKEDSVQRKYISLSDGERIDIIGETDTEETAGLFGTMLSSIASVFDDLQEFFS